MKNEQLFEQCLQTKFLYVLLMFPRFSSINLNEYKHGFHLLIQKCITDDKQKAQINICQTKTWKVNFNFYMVLNDEDGNLFSGIGNSFMRSDFCSQ